MMNFIFGFPATDSDLARSPPGAYDQQWPPLNRDEFSPSDKPPFLPPHLLNIILNKDTAAHVRITDRHEDLFFILLTTCSMFFSTNQLYCLNQITLC